MSSRHGSLTPSDSLTRMRAENAPISLSTSQGAKLEVDHEVAHHRIEEAQLFIEAAYNCYARLGAA